MVTTIGPEKFLIDIPERRQMSYEEYLKFAPDSRIVEWVNGEAVIHMPPALEHQDIVGFLDRLLSLFVHFFDLGILILAPFEVRLWPSGPAREPDLIFVAKQNLSKLIPERFQGGPDLLVEIISPSSVTEDRVRKFTEYEQAGVREYWLIDPRPHQQQVDFYVLGADKVFHPVSLTGDGIYHSTVMSGFWLKTDWLWQTPLPNPQLIFAQIIASKEELPAELKAAYETIQKWLAGTSKS
jgi:Uma2 family endonuclease